MEAISIKHILKEAKDSLDDAMVWLKDSKYPSVGVLEIVKNRTQKAEILLELVEVYDCGSSGVLETDKKNAIELIYMKDGSG